MSPFTKTVIIIIRISNDLLLQWVNTNVVMYKNVPLACIVKTAIYVCVPIVESIYRGTKPEK